MRRVTLSGLRRWTIGRRWALFATLVGVRLLFGLRPSVPSSAADSEDDELVYMDNGKVKLYSIDGTRRAILSPSAASAGFDARGGVCGASGWTLAGAGAAAARSWRRVVILVDVWRYRRTPIGAVTEMRVGGARMQRPSGHWSGRTGLGPSRCRI